MSGLSVRKDTPAQPAAGGAAAGLAPIAGAASAAALSGPQKAMLFLVSLDEAVATRIFSHLSEEEVRLLRKASDELNEIAPTTVLAVHREFAELAGRGVPASLRGSSAYLRRLAGKALGEGKVAELWIDRPVAEGAVAALARLDDATILGMLELEQSQTVAVVMGQLEPARAAELLGQMPSARQAEIVLRTALMRSVPESVIEEIEQELSGELATFGQAKRRKVGGVEAAASLMKRMKPEICDGIIEQVASTDTRAADEIRRALFTFDDLVRIDGRGMQTLLKEISTDQLVLALKTASDDLKEKVFGNVSTRAAATLREELEILGPVRVADVENAQRAIIEIAMGLERDGKIQIAREGAGDYV